MTCGCGQPAPNGYLCPDDEKALEQVLTEMPAMIDYLEDAIAGRVRFSGGRVGGRSAETPMVINPRASQIAGDLRVELVRIIRHLIESRGVSPTKFPEDDLTAMARWVAAHLGSIRQDETAWETLTALQALTRRIVRVIDRPPDMKYLGKCSALIGDDECPQELEVEVGSQSALCRTCGTRHEVSRRREVLVDASRDILLTITEMRTALPELLGIPINERTVRSWKRRKRIVPASVDWDGQELFRCGDVIDLVTGMEGKAS